MRILRKMTEIYLIIHAYIKYVKKMFKQITLKNKWWDCAIFSLTNHPITYSNEFLYRTYKCT